MTDGLRIESLWYYATLDVTDDGIVVEIWQRRIGGMAKRDIRDVVDAPLHVVADHVYQFLRSLPPPLDIMGA
jgi:hypothetical protein